MYKTFGAIAVLLLLLAACQQDPLKGQTPQVQTSEDGGSAADDGASGTDAASADGQVEEGCRTVRFGSLNSTLRAPQGTCVEITQGPEWSTSELASAKFIRPSGKEYSLLIFDKPSSESFEEWMKRAPVGDSYMSEEIIEMRNGLRGYAYTSNDLGAGPDIHVTIPGENLVYYFKSDEAVEEIPADLVEFIRELDIH